MFMFFVHGEPHSTSKAMLSIRESRKEIVLHVIHVRIIVSWVQGFQEKKLLTPFTKISSVILKLTRKWCNNGKQIEWQTVVKIH